MLTVERKALLLDALGKEGRIIAKEFSQKLGLSEDTIRRDLRELAGEGLLQRVHGGALPASQALGDLATRGNVFADDKAEIAKIAAGLVKQGQIVFLDGGTTTIKLARALPKALKATIVTHSPDVATALRDHSGVEVELIGGRIYKHSNVSSGSVAIEAIGQIRTDLYFMGVTGIHAEHGLTTGDREEAAVKRAICRQAAETIVLGSREKLGAVSAYSVAGVDEVDALIVSRKCPEDLLSRLRQVGMQITGTSS